jgi:hypothetical protein
MKDNLADIGSMGRSNSELQWADSLEDTRKRIKRHTMKSNVISELFQFKKRG